MGNGQCKGVTVSGSQCRRQATTGDYCKTHRHQGPPTDAANIEGGGVVLDEGLRFEFLDIAREVWGELKTLDIPPGARPQYWGIIVNCLKYAKEDERRNEGQHVVYRVVHEDPLRPEEDLPPLPELPPPSSGGEG